jgi:hypothetical protein
MAIPPPPEAAHGDPRHRPEAFGGLPAFPGIFVPGGLEHYKNIP